jgi:Leucine-rich repeat (LRR) protein
LVNISVLANLKNLNYLDLSLTEIVDVSALAKLTNLKALALSYTKVVDVSALVNLTNLKLLYLNGRNVDVSALTKMLPKLDVFQ